MSAETVSAVVPGCTCGHESDADWLDHRPDCLAPTISIRNFTAAFGACIPSGALTGAEEFTISSVLEIARHRHGVPGADADSGRATLRRNVEAVFAEGGA